MRLRARAGSVLALASVLAIGPAGGPAAYAASDPPQVTVISPTSGASLSGTISVEFEVTLAAGTTASTAQVQVADINATLGVRSVTVSVADCVALVPCPKTVPISTVSAPNGAGTVTIRVRYGSAGGMAIAFQPVVYDNPLPTVAITAPADSAQVWGTAVPVHVDVLASARDDADPVAEVRLYDSASSLGGASPVTSSWGRLAATATSAPWDLSWDTTVYVPGYRYLRVVAIDTAGRWSEVARRTVIAHPGLTVTSNYVAGPNPNYTFGPFAQPGLDVLTAGWTVAEPANVNDIPSSPTWWIDRVELSVDGTVVDTDTDSGCSWACGANHHRITVTSGSEWDDTAATPGEHTLTITAVDNHGITGSASTTVSVGHGVVFSPVTTATGTAFPDDSAVAAGSALDLRIPTAAADEHGRLYIWQTAVDGTVLGNDSRVCLNSLAACPASTTIPLAWTVPVTATGTHTLTVRVLNVFDGEPATLTRTVHVYPATALQATAVPASAVYGTKVTVKGVLRRTDTSALMAGQPLTLQWRPAGASAWTEVGAAATDANGAVTQLLTPSGNGSYRFVFAAQPGVWAPSEATVAVTVSARVTIALSATTAKYGKAVTVTGTASGAEPGVKLVLQRKSGAAWVTVGTGAEPVSGKVAFAVKLARGRYSLRISKTGTPRLGSAVSAAATLAVT
ncbi:MAG: large repetitive protein [Cryptosporangiaceae bacterium]|nr:large repetitive protein [Cryptosporangiaceae bacterium]